MNKVNGGDEIPAELLKILKDGAVKVLHSLCQQIWKILKEMGVPDHLNCLLRKLYMHQEATDRTDSKLGKEYDKAVYCHLAYLTYVQSTLCDMPAG